MNRFLFRLLISVTAFLFGVLAVFVILRIESRQPQKDSDETSVPDRQEAVVDVDLPSDYDHSNQALDDIWLNDDETRISGYVIKRICGPSELEIVTCRLLITQHGRRVETFESEPGDRDKLRYGFFKFLGQKEKQLIVHTYTGGAHCCYDYYIFDLSPKFRVIYTSSKFDSANEIGNELVPVDIDQDGVSEFYQDVMAFDYMAPGGHATASFPPAVFAYNRHSGRYVLANKRFPGFVLKQLQKNLDGFEKWRADNKRRGSETSQEDIDELRIRETFLYWVYAGKRNDAWAYFEKNYKSPTGDQYRDEFREKFMSDFHQLFANDPTYRSIYGR